MSPSDSVSPLPTQLDHVVVLLPYTYLADPPAWLTDNFTISPGGLHADGKTENRLILFRDGTYLELIAFVNDDPEARKGHWWDKPYGIVDFALTTRDDLDWLALKQRLQRARSGISYAEPRAGGRLRPDGVELKWKVTFPIGAERGDVPFWCHDVTPRERRVPVSEASTTHPSGALGMGGLVVEVGSDKIEQIGTALSDITEQSQKNGRYAVGHHFDVDDLRAGYLEVGALGSGSKVKQRLTLSLQTPGKASRELRQDIKDGKLLLKLEG